MDFMENVRQGFACVQKGEFDEALKKFRAAQGIQDNAEIRQMIEMVETQANMASKAAQACINEAKHRANLMEPLFGIKLEEVTDVGKIITEYELNQNRASAKDILASAYYIRGLLFESEEKNGDALDDYKKAVENKPDYFLAIKNRGRTSLKCGRASLELSDQANRDFKQAIHDFEQLYQLNQNDAQAKHNLADAYMAYGMAYNKKGDYAHAIDNYKMGLALVSDDSGRELLEMAEAEMAKAKK